MSTRGVNFLDKWMARHLPTAMIDDPMAIGVLTEQAMKAATEAGISSDEIAEEVGGVFDVISEAMQHRYGGSPN
ncbi:hypothetical protein [Mesorhizobium sp. ORM16]|uniref:hypothetical protein n=1 Tax=Mesorhizobium sp. ORM16 TaxID=3376989 RepID=UPI0038576CFD